MSRLTIAATLGLSLLVLFGAAGSAPRGPYVPPRPVGGPSAIDRGVLAGGVHAPDSPEARRRIGLRTAAGRDRRGATGAFYQPGHLIVKFRSVLPPGVKLAALSHGSRTAVLAARKTNANFDMVRIDPGEDAEAVAARLSARAEVEYAQAAYRVQPRFVPNDPLYGAYQWNLPLIGMERAWDIQPRAGSAITVAVLDTGLAYTGATLTRDIGEYTDDAGTVYPALGTVTIPYAAAPQLLGPGGVSRIVAPHDFVWDTDTPFDFHGHGTHVAGTIGQLTNDGVGTAGIAYNVRLMPVKVICTTWDIIFGAPDASCSDATVARGIRYAADNGARVINMSIGRTGPPSPVVEDAMRYAVAKGVFIAVAAGNAFEAGNPVEVLAEIASRLQGAVSVAAVDRTAVGQPAGGCQPSFGSDVCHAYYSSVGSWVELAAPGGSDRTFFPFGLVYQQTFDSSFTDTFLSDPSLYTAPRFDVLGYAGYAGTSMATAHVSGVAAMLMQQGITNPRAVEAALERFAIDLGVPGRDDTYGYGLVDARRALRGLGLAR